MGGTGHLAGGRSKKKPEQDDAPSRCRGDEGDKGQRVVPALSFAWAHKELIEQVRGLRRAGG